MKARHKVTGVLLDVVPKLNTNNLYVCDNKVYSENELDFEHIENKSINWEQRRYEIAKDAMQGMLNNQWKNFVSYSVEYQYIANVAVKFADALIEELKKK